MPPYDKQGLISWLYQEFTPISIWPSQRPQCSPPYSYRKSARFLQKKRLQLLSARFQEFTLASPALVLCLLPGDTLFLPSPVRLKIQIHRYWSLFQIFPKIQTETLSTWLCSLQASNNSPWVPGIPDSTNSSQSPVHWLLPGLGEAEIKQLSNWYEKNETPI